MFKQLKTWLITIGGLLLTVITLGAWATHERRGRLKAEAVAHLRKELADIERDIQAKQKALDRDTKRRLRALRSRRKALERALLKRREEVLTDKSNVVDWVNDLDDD